MDIIDSFPEVFVGFYTRCLFDKIIEFITLSLMFYEWFSHRNMPTNVVDDFFHDDSAPNIIKSAIWLAFSHQREIKQRDHRTMKTTIHAAKRKILPIRNNAGA